MKNMKELESERLSLEDLKENKTRERGRETKSKSKKATEEARASAEKGAKRW